MPNPRSLRVSTEALVLALAFPLLAVHPTYSPGVNLGLGSADVTVDTGDVAILAIVVAALLA